MTTLNAALDGFVASFSAAGGGTFDLDCNSISGLALTGGGGKLAAVQSTTAGLRRVNHLHLQRRSSYYSV